MTEAARPPLIPADIHSLDSEAFGALVEPHRRELHVHCYRMTGCIQDAEDMVQETFLRAWRRRETYEGRASFRAWLYKIATNACLDALKRQPRRVVPLTHQTVSSPADPIPPAVIEPIWLEPYPDDLLVPHEDEPEHQMHTREGIALAFMTALHLLPPRQRAILVLRDVLDWQATEVAALLDISESAVKSALHRARSTLAAHSGADEAAQHLDSLDHTRLEAYVRAWETADVDLLLSLLKDDATFSMPPIPSWYRGRAAIGALVSKTIFSGQASGRWRLLPTRANGQLAFGLYRQGERPDLYNFYAIQVLTVSDNGVSDITTFRNPALFAAFHLPPTLVGETAT